MHFPRKYEACKSKTETLRDENVFLELKVRTESFYLYHIYKLFTVIYQTCVVPKYSVGPTSTNIINLRSPRDCVSCRVSCRRRAVRACGMC